MEERKRCKHFTGVQKKICKLGHTYKNFSTGKGPLHRSIPCLASSPVKEICSDRRNREPTPVTLDKKDSVPVAIKIVRTIQELYKNSEHSKTFSGSMDCPSCKEKDGVHFSRTHQGSRENISAHCNKCSIAIIT